MKIVHDSRQRGRPMYLEPKTGAPYECKDLEKLLETGETVRNACKSVTAYPRLVGGFDGSEIAIEYVNGEERFYIEQKAPASLLALPSGGADIP